MVEEGEPNWVNELLRCTFFESCDDHSELSKNEKNIFCLTCNLELCRHCIETHRFHNQIQICRYVYQDVVRLHDIQKHLDCSKIQSYKINDKVAIHLRARPKDHDSRPSTKAKFAGYCEACSRYIQDMLNRFCSIECKARSVTLRPRNSRLVTIAEEQNSSLTTTDDYSTDETITDQEKRTMKNLAVNSTLKLPRRICKRKGTPRRSPSC